jgi:hypothetical protein
MYSAASKEAVSSLTRKAIPPGSCFVEQLRNVVYALQLPSLLDKLGLEILFAGLL